MSTTRVQPERRLRFGIGPRIYLGMGGAVALTLAASLVAWFVFSDLARTVREITEDSVPTMAQTLRLAQRSAAIASIAPKMVAAESTNEREAVRQSLESEHAGLKVLMESLHAHAHSDDGLEDVSAHIDLLAEQLSRLDRHVQRRIALTRDLRLLGEGAAATHKHFQEVLAPLVDDETFYVVTGYRSLQDAAAVPIEGRFASDFLLSYAGTAQAGGEVNLLAGLIAQAVELSEASYLVPLQERFEAAANRLQSSLSTIDDTGVIFGIAASLIAMGTGETGVFSLRKDLLDERSKELRVLEHSRRTAEKLVSQVGQLVRIHENRTSEAAAESDTIVSTGGWLLLALNVVSVSGALLIAWLYVGRGLLQRLTALAGSMRQMAAGDLTVPIDRTGRDEVTDMADALEVFRRHALEVQRLNLVEKLAEEVNQKNAALEATLAELEQAKDRIVVQEKMASLCELTAGVAHEIKNPLNFVNNFSMLSVELLEDLEGELKAVADRFDADNREEIEAMIDDLRVNMEKITSHGKRADGIVRSMLLHSRGDVGEPQATSVNDLIEEFMNLAYHGMRAQGTEFNATLERDYGESVGEIEAVSQDLGRVLLNIINNAFQAMQEKATNAEAGSYAPILRVTTKDGGDHVKITIRDNGPGIPKKVAEKIFEPFFTTKPTGQGTGLGLSIAYDVVFKQHGGTLELNTEPGEYTEFVITLPRKMPSANWQ